MCIDECKGFTNTDSMPGKAGGHAASATSTDYAGCSPADSNYVYGCLYGAYRRGLTG